MRPMAAALALATLTFAVAAASSTSSSNVSEAQTHLRKACEIVWSGANQYEIDRCTERTMAAMSDHERLRDSELKRLLFESEEELETCQAELHRLSGASAPDTAPDFKAAEARGRKPPQ